MPPTEPSWATPHTRRHRIHVDTGQQPVKANQVYVLELARRVLPIFETVYPDNRDPRRAIEVATQYFCDPTSVSREFLMEAAERSTNAAHSAMDRAAADAASTASNAANYVLFSEMGILSFLNYAIEAAADAMGQVATHTSNPASPHAEAQALFQHVRGPLHTKFDPSWRTPDAVNLAREIVQTRNTDLLPILADALEEAGFNDETTLNQLRHETIGHTPATWVVRKLLGEP